MNTRTKVIVTTLVFGVLAFALSHVIWPDPVGAVQPTAGQMPLFLFLSALEALSFGLGISFIIFGWPLVRELAKGDRAEAVLSYMAISWFLISWWPHDNLHRVNGMDQGGLLKIEYGFHFTLIIAGFVLAYYFVRRMRELSSETREVRIQ